MKRWLSLLALVALTVGFAANATAAECEGVEYPSSITVDGKKLVLNGMGIREATFMEVDVYVAALYVPKKSSSPEKLVDPSTPKRLILHFVRDVDKSDIVDAYKASFEKAPEATQKKLKSEFAKLLSWMSSIKEGQRQVFTYIPGKGTEVKTKGKVHGVLKGEEFVKFFLNIWLADPPNEGLKTGLLGGECG
jgi:hypothetical protein